MKASSSGVCTARDAQKNPWSQIALARCEEILLFYSFCGDLSVEDGIYKDLFLCTELPDIVLFR